MFCRKILCSASQYKAENLENVDTEGLTFFEDLVKESSFSSSLIVLVRDYDVAMNNKNDPDERVLLNVEDSLHGTGNLSGGAMNITGFQRKFDSMASPTKTVTSPLIPPCSPAPSYVNGHPGGANTKMAPTSVSTAMITAKWVRTVISPLC
ncbi:hypothetical protein MKX03_006565 [Papaver bracteatum]|nr:hypothetical protein MKX03_006565 [Papaver bracteatum]